MCANYEIPKWAGKACQGLHLDVLKSGAFVEKILIDDKIGYFFGRNKDVCDVVIDHASCSRVHALLLYHKHVKRSFIVDLDSSHGTFVNGIRLEAKKPTPIEINSILSFGASTRTYSLREKPETSSASRPTMTTTDGGGGGEENVELPEQEAKLLDLTEYNTAQNKRVSTVGISEEGVGMVEGKRRRKRSSVHFQEDEEIINPEDVDPNVGRFRNMVQSTVIQPIKKRPHIDNLSKTEADSSSSASSHSPSSQSHLFSSFFPSTINSAPDINPAAEDAALPITPTTPPATSPLFPSNEKQHKKYAKEAWPGKQSTSNRLI